MRKAQKGEPRLQPDRRGFNKGKPVPQGRRQNCTGLTASVCSGSIKHATRHKRGGCPHLPSTP